MDDYATKSPTRIRRQRIEILSWANSCNQRMRSWAHENGVFVALDDFYEPITFMEPSRPGYELAAPRETAPLDLSRRETAPPPTP